jgi:hypothetical protein
MRMLGDYYNIKDHKLTMFIEEVLPDKMNGRIIMIPKELDHRLLYQCLLNYIMRV